MSSERPDTFHLDLTGGNGTPFRFVFWPETGELRCYDRRYSYRPDERVYHERNYNENGQSCGGPMALGSFTRPRPTGIQGWHEVEDWDIDRASVVLVAAWLHHVASAYGLEL